MCQCGQNIRNKCVMNIRVCSAHGFLGAYELFLCSFVHFFTSAYAQKICDRFNCYKSDLLENHFMYSILTLNHPTLHPLRDTPKFSHNSQSIVSNICACLFHNRTRNNYSFSSTPPAHFGHWSNSPNPHQCCYKNWNKCNNEMGNTDKSPWQLYTVWFFAFCTVKAAQKTSPIYSSQSNHHVDHCRMLVGREHHPALFAN